MKSTHYNKVCHSLAPIHLNIPIIMCLLKHPSWLQKKIIRSIMYSTLKFSLYTDVIYTSYLLFLENSCLRFVLFHVTLTEYWLLKPHVQETYFHFTCIKMGMPKQICRGITKWKNFLIVFLVPLILLPIVTTIDTKVSTLVRSFIFIYFL